ncbi:nucleotidyltransferase domain-containing protein [Lacinutrix neustonica]|uniref:Nucleotidyltransferase domain-containing protein n=1 Tax=Lacinutrix neustonica TaxID=2980107 RepID=A0A9E8N0U4_9FLAO|nr:nucleotidyltransferase domain-containing protein [Lacinutrix neustonica]WAC03765.1 nucleotidyltransferase domain-containing protein [Lacinutrix neustonica]
MIIVNLIFTIIDEYNLLALKPILYYSIFNYPLTKEEIFLYSQSQNRDIIENEIKTLESINVLKEHKGFYIYNNDTAIAERRLISNRKAMQIMPKALKRAQFISKFPYVKSVSISGALSKGSYDNDGDIDFFIITKPNRLWIARTSLILYKKIFLLNSKKYFCVNYFISTNHPEISEKNLFTATELATLIPVTGKKTYTAFLEKNSWAKKHFPNINALKEDDIKDVKPFIVSKLRNWH